MSINVKSADGDPLGLGTPPVAGNGEPSLTVAPDSIIAGLRARSAAQQVLKTEAFSVGGEFGDWLQIRYTPLKPDQLDDFLAKLDDVNMQRAIQMNMDMMAKACVSVEGCDPDTGERQILQWEGQNVGLDNRLAVLLELPNPAGIPLTAREVIALIFGNNGPAIGAHGDRVTEWMRDPKVTKKPVT